MPDQPVSCFRREPKRDINHRLFLAADRCVETARSDVGFLRTDPRFAAAKLPPASEQRLQKLLPDTLLLVSSRHANFVHPQLGRFVGMDVVHSGRHADNLPAEQRNRHVMPGIGEKFGGPSRVDRGVENVWRDAIEDCGVGWAQHAYGQGLAHRVCSPNVAGQRIGARAESTGMQALHDRSQFDVACGGARLILRRPVSRYQSTPNVFRQALPSSTRLAASDASVISMFKAKV